MKGVGGCLAAVLALTLTQPFLAAGAGMPLSGLMDTNGTVSVGAPAPAIVGSDIKGAAITAETFKGRPVLLDFGSLFCVSCQQTIKEFVRLQKDYQATDLALVVVTDSLTSSKVMASTFASLGATYTVIRDEGSKLFESYGVKIIPFQVVIDRQGIVRKIHSGFDPEMETVLGLKELAGLGGTSAK